MSKLWTLSFLNVCIANFLMACSFNLLMPSIPLYVTEYLGVHQSQTGVVLASYAIALLFIRPFSGYIVDVFPRKKILIVALACYVLIFFGYFWATTVLLFVLVRFLHGLTWGLTTVSSSTIAIDIVPSERRAEGVGFYGTFMNVAMAIGPFIAIHIYQIHGFQMLLWCAIGMGVLGIIAVSFIKVPARDTKAHVEKPSLDRFFLLRAWPIFLNQLLFCFAWGTIGPFIAQYGLMIKIDNPGIFFPFLAGGLIFSRIFSGRLVDRGHIHSVIVIAMLLVALAFLMFATIHGSVAFLASGFVIGSGFGMMLPALQTIYVNMAPNSLRGTANSTYLLAFDLGLAFGMLGGGYISGHFSFETLYLIAFSFCIAGIVIYLSISRFVYEKRRLK